MMVAAILHIAMMKILQAVLMQAALKDTNVLMTLIIVHLHHAFVMIVAGMVIGIALKIVAEEAAN